VTLVFSAGSKGGAGVPSGCAGVILHWCKSLSYLNFSAAATALHCAISSGLHAPALALSCQCA
jgi:hypothetical protein